jgi:hypothetical protein
VVSVTDHYGRIVGFQTEAATFLLSTSIYSVVLTRLSGPRSRSKEYRTLTQIPCFLDLLVYENTFADI